jgi:enamine deaminase RidA (YjgF/YER057c/UK114 family)
MEYVLTRLETGADLMTPHVRLTVIERNGRPCVSTGSPWENVVGYSRAVRAGDSISVTGTVGLEPDGRYSATLKGQARRAMEIIIAAIEALGGKAADVVRTRIYVTDIEHWREVAEVHHEFFESIRPATTMVQVARLIDAEALVEIEADALIRHEAHEPSAG